MDLFFRFMFTNFFLNAFSFANTQQTFQCCFHVVFWLIRSRDVGQRQINVVYFNVGIYNVEQRRINILYFNVEMNNVRQQRNNVFFFNVQFYNAGKRRNNVVKMTISKKDEKKYIFQIEYTEFKVLTTIS